MWVVNYLFDESLIVRFVCVQDDRVCRIFVLLSTLFAYKCYGLAGLLCFLVVMSIMQCGTLMDMY